MLLDHESAVSEISVRPSGVGCGTTMTTSDDKGRLPPRKKHRKMTKAKEALAVRRNQKLEGRARKEVVMIKEGILSV